MIKRKSEIPCNVQTKFKEGIGEVSIYPFMTEQEARGSGRVFAKMALEPGNSVGYHQHAGDVEAVYFIKGNALVNDNGVEVTAEAGDCNICFDGQFHSIKNIGEDTLEYIAIIVYTKQKEVAV